MKPRFRTLTLKPRYCHVSRNVTLLLTSPSRETREGRSGLAGGRGLAVLPLPSLAPGGSRPQAARVLRAARRIVGTAGRFAGSCRSLAFLRPCRLLVCPLPAPHVGRRSLHVCLHAGGRPLVLPRSLSLQLVPARSPGTGASRLEAVWLFLLSPVLPVPVSPSCPSVSGAAGTVTVTGLCVRPWPCPRQ